MRAKIGDIVEIPTAHGLRYAQYSHKHPRFGELLRVLPGRIPTRPSRLGNVVNHRELYFVFFPLQAALRQGIFEVVGTAPVPPGSAAFPRFRAAGWMDPTSKQVIDWWIWDGEREWRVGELTAELRRLSVREIWTDVMLVQRLEEDWTPETDGSRADGYQPTPPSASLTPDGEAAPGARWHYLYFRTEAAADNAVADLADRGSPSEKRRGADGRSWLVLVPSLGGVDLSAEQAPLEEVSRRHGGEYDGWEMRPRSRP